MIDTKISRNIHSLTDLPDFNPTVGTFPLLVGAHHRIFNRPLITNVDLRARFIATANAETKRIIFKLSTITALTDEHFQATEAAMKTSNYTRQEIVSAIKLMKSPVRIRTHTQVFIKDESYPEPKAPRNINARHPTARWMLISEIKAIEEQVYLKYKHNVIKHRTPQEVQDQLYMMSLSKHHLVADFSSYESSLQHDILTSIELPLMLEYITCPYLRELLYKHYTIVTKHCSTREDVDYYSLTCRQSGDLWTSLGNTLTNILLHYFIKEYTRINFDFICEGDDVYVSAKKRYDLNIYKEIGFKITGKWTKDPFDLDFLSRYIASPTPIPKVSNQVRKFVRAKLGPQLPETLTGLMNSFCSTPVICKAISKLIGIYGSRPYMRRDAEHKLKMKDHPMTYLHRVYFGYETGLPVDAQRSIDNVKESETRYDTLTRYQPQPQYWTQYVHPTRTYVPPGYMTLTAATLIDFQNRPTWLTATIAYPIHGIYFYDKDLMINFIRRIRSIQMLFKQSSPLRMSYLKLACILEIISCAKLEIARLKVTGLGILIECQEDLEEVWPDPYDVNDRIRELERNLSEQARTDVLDRLSEYLLELSITLERERSYYLKVRLPKLAHPFPIIHTPQDCRDWELHVATIITTSARTWNLAGYLRVQRQCLGAFTSEQVTTLIQRTRQIWFKLQQERCTKDGSHSSI
uniref:RNA-directed RNA polymerase n=1 Tax=Sedov virus TaxID=2707262 RepID=A0A6H0DIQ0_9VIRU|nr:MAG: RNA-dependent RNA polymerase [Sedov virus]